MNDAESAHTLQDRKTVMRAKVVEMLAATANGCLTELGYYPGMVQKLQQLATLNNHLRAENAKIIQLSTQLQTDNVKLYEDNRTLHVQTSNIHSERQAFANERNALIRQIAVLNDQVGFAGLSETAQMQRFKLMSDQIHMLVQERDQLRRQPEGRDITQDAEYQGLLIKHMQLQSKHKAVSYEVATLRSIVTHISNGSSSKFDGTPPDTAPASSSQHSPVTSQVQAKHVRSNTVPATLMPAENYSNVLEHHQLPSSTVSPQSDMPQATVQSLPFPTAPVVPPHTITASDSRKPALTPINTSITVPREVIVLVSPDKVDGSQPLPSPRSAAPSPTERVESSATKRRLGEPEMVRKRSRLNSDEQDSPLIAPLSNKSSPFVSPTITHSPIPVEQPRLSENSPMSVIVPDTPLDTGGDEAQHASDNAHAPAHEQTQDTEGVEHPFQDLVDHVFDEDEEDETKETCNLCLLRFEHGHLAERPKPYVGASIEELVEHCKTEHPPVYEFFLKGHQKQHETLAV